MVVFAGKCLVLLLYILLFCYGHAFALEFPSGIGENKASFPVVQPKPESEEEVDQTVGNQKKLPAVISSDN
ncbi:MAG: hypothetical protein ACK47R_21410, partial [Planctomycetia bacterium]